MGYVWFVVYIALIWVANWAIATFGVVDVGFGLQAPAAVLVVGWAFTIRDMLQESLGKRAVVVAILVGAVLSFFVNPALAVASAAAFFVSELADFAVYTPLAERGRWYAGIALSNSVGIVLDSIVFLWLADMMQFLPGQIVGKAWVTLVVLVAIAVVRAFLVWWKRRQREVEA